MDGNVYRGVLRSFSLKDGYGFVRCSELLETFGRVLMNIGMQRSSHVQLTGTSGVKGELRRCFC